MEILNYHQLHQTNTHPIKLEAASEGDETFPNAQKEISEARDWAAHLYLAEGHEQVSTYIPIMCETFNTCRDISPSII